MNKWFYSRLAVMNIKKNKKTYLPYLLTCIFTIAVFYMILSLSGNRGLDEMRGGSSLKLILSLGVVVTGIFAVIFLFYTNSFLTKRRKKEFGLYNILGMEKRHLGRVLFLENLFIGGGSLIVGTLLGILLDKLMYLLLINMLQAEISLGFYVSHSAVLVVLGLFGAIFLATFLNGLRQIHIANPIELLQGSNTGEQEPRAKWMLALAGILSLGAGYYIALTTDNPIAALAMFFVAVVLVIIGTYCLFTAGSIAVLKLLKKNKSFYYNPRHFVGISGMLYRMKQNAVGLANICILSTMVLVMLSSTISLWVGMKDMIATRYPADYVVYLENREDLEGMSKATIALLEKEEVEVEYMAQYSCLSVGSLKEEGGFSTKNIRGEVGIEDIAILHFVPLEDYNRVTEKNATLEDDQVLFYSKSPVTLNGQVHIFDYSVTIKEYLQEFIPIEGTSSMEDQCFFVVKDFSTLEQLARRIWEENQGEGEISIIDHRVDFSLKASNDKKEKILDEIDQLGEEHNYHYVMSTLSVEEEFLGTFGGLFFVGIFLGSLFIMATILIIYYKQISEGYDDKKRFEIMQKVGMSHSEIKKTIHSQILIVFFLPLVTAGVHIAVAFPFITKILRIFEMTNQMLFGICNLICFFVFAAFYAIVYALTAKVYYKIISNH